MTNQISPHDVIGLAKTEVDVHTLGITTIDEILQECGFRTVIVDSIVSRAFSEPKNFDNFSIIEKWIIEKDIHVLGFSYRLSADDGVKLFRELMSQLNDRRLFANNGGPLKNVCFAGLPDASEMIKHIFNNEVGVFYGDETPLESLKILCIDPSLAPNNITTKHPYDDFLERFGKEIIQKADYSSIEAVDRHLSKNFGSKEEKLVDRIKHSRENGLPPIIRAHAGPYQQNKDEAVEQFLDWSRKLSQGGLLDVLSIGTSQLTQERFGEEWGGLPNGGGVPIDSPEQYRMIYDASRPMLVRTYAGTRNIKGQASIFEDTINMAWHALSLWWFSQIDGRGPNSVLDNLKEHLDTIEYIASTEKPYEPNIPHQFAFRSSDDISYIVSAVLAARVAKKLGINELILQIMLNVPKHTRGINDLAKARATLVLVRQLEDADFRVYLQTRAGLDYLSHVDETAKAQLAAVSAMMDDIESHCPYSPDIIHVVNYSEGNQLATPDIIEESIRITRHALDSYRYLKTKGDVDDMSKHPDVESRMNYLIEGATEVLTTIESCVVDPYSPQGLYDILKMGFLPVPQLMYCREDFPEALRWKTKMRNGCVDIYSDGKKMSTKERMDYIKEEVLNR